MFWSLANAPKRTLFKLVFLMVFWTLFTLNTTENSHRTSLTVVSFFCRKALGSIVLLFFTTSLGVLTVRWAIYAVVYCTVQDYWLFFLVSLSVYSSEQGPSLVTILVRFVIGFMEVTQLSSVLLRNSYFYSCKHTSNIAWTFFYWFLNTFLESVFQAEQFWFAYVL